MKLTAIQIERFLMKLHRIWSGLCGTTGQIYVWDRIAEYRAMWQALSVAAGADFRPLAKDLWEISRDGGCTRILNDKLPLDNPVALEMAGRKAFIYELFQAHGLRVPPFQLFSLNSLESAYAFLETQPQGCVVKPASGTSSGQGVTTHLKTRTETRRAAILASQFDHEILIEPMIPGECYRLLVFQGRMLHAVGRRLPRLHGDGRSTVADLMSGENRRRARQGLTPLAMDRDCTFTLHSQSLTPETIPEEGREFRVKSVDATARHRSEVRTVYNTDVTVKVCAAIRADAEQAAALLASDLVGVDFITSDICRPLGETGGVINEVNTTPGFHHHYDQHTEAYPQIALPILEALLGQSRVKGSSR